MFFHQANETQGTDMSDPSEVNQPHPVLFVQGHGRYIQVPYYVPVHTPQIYPNFPVDPNHPHWFTGPPYGNPPIPNGRPSENDANETEQSVDDERPTATTFSPVVNLPPVSTMQPHPMYLQHFPNIYVPPYVNPPMYPGLPTNGEPNAPQNSNRRGGGGGKGGSGGKLGSEKQGGANDSYNASAPPLAPQDSNAGNDGSAAPTSMPMVGPAPQPNFMQLGTMQYPYPYFSATAPPHPPAHITSATHAAGSPIYIPHHPAVTMYHPSMYNSGPTAVYSSDNGMPHSAVAVPVSVAPPSGAHNEAAFGVKENANEEAYKNSTLMADSAPFEPENQKQNNVTFVPQQQQPAQQQDNASSTAVNDVTMENSALPKDANEMAANDIGLVAENEKSPGADDKFQRVDVAGAQPTESNVVDEEAKAAAKCDVNNVSASLNNLHVTAKEDGTATPVDGKDAYSVSDTNDSKSTATDTSSNTFETDKTTETTGSWNDNAKNSAAVENVNGKNSSSPDTSPSSAFDLSAAKSTSSSETKSEVIEEPAPVQGSCKKSWASLFKESSSSTKSKPTTGPTRLVTGEQINSNVSTSSSQHVDSVSSKSSSGNSSLNGMPLIMSAQSKTQSYKLSSSSLADDTMLPKIGELLKNYKLDHRAVNIEPRGLENRSNYCYINAILQALLACPPFYNLMKSISHNLHHKTKLAAKQHFPIIDSMVQFVEEFKLVPQKARRDKTRKLDTGPQEIIPGKPFEPSYMYNMLAVIQNNSTFTMGQQEDAQEFLTCLLNGLNDEMVELIQLAEGTNNGLNNARKTPQQVTKPIANSKNNKKISNGDISTEVLGPDDCDSEWQQVQPKIKTHRPNLALTRTPLSEIFRGQMRSRLQKIGDQSTNTIEPFFTLHLNIEKANSVKEALELLVGRDAVEGVTSSRTNQEVDAWQQQTLEELPYVLLLHLKYFDYKHHTCTKIKKSIEFPIDLKLDTKLISAQSALRSKTASNKSRQYKLFAVVYHDGNEATKGHYITDVFHIGYGGWVRYDDARVCTVSENDVLKPDLPRVPYLLYYRRCDTIAALMQPPFEKRIGTR